MAQPMIVGIPLPDFGDDDEDVAALVEARSYSPVRISKHKLSYDEETELERGLNLGPVKWTVLQRTQNSCVYRVDGKLISITLKVSSYQRRLQEEGEKRRLLPESDFLLLTMGMLSLTTSKTAIVMELGIGDISGTRFPEEEVWVLVQDICAALGVMHAVGWIHLDVSPSNIIRVGTHFKLGDFGTTLRIGEFTSGKEGVGPFVAPECLRFPSQGVGSGADIFSFGCVLAEAATGIAVPRGGEAGYRDLRNGKLFIGVGRFPDARISPVLANLINRMLQTNPLDRPTARQILAIFGSPLATTPP